MWIITSKGMISAVQKKEGMHARARDRRVLDWITESVGSDCPEVQESWPGSDHEWRILMTLAEWKTVMCFLAESVDYGNFKAEVALQGDPDYTRTTHDVYRVCLTGR